MNISYNFTVEEWDASTEQLIISFWESRKIKFDKKSEKRYEGIRGSAFGNLISFDMSKLITKLNIITDDNNEIRCEFDINTFGQLITKWNKEFWKLELETFESVLLKKDYKEIEWKNYYKIASKKNLLWVILFSTSVIFLYEMVRVF